jgi:DNA polymerase-3 subunit epsilon
VHGITDADVAGEPKFRQYAKGVRDFLEGCDIAGFNVLKFDLPCLEAEFVRAGVEFSRKGRSLVDSMVIYHQRDPRNLEAAYRKYCGGNMKNAHCAQEDATATAAILDGQLEMHKDLPRDVPGLCALCGGVGENWVDADGKFIWVDGEAVFNFSKEKGRRLKDVAAENPGFLAWILGRDFPPGVKEIVSNAIKGVFPEQS